MGIGVLQIQHGEDKNRFLVLSQELSGLWIQLVRINHVRTCNLTRSITQATGELVHILQADKT